MPGVVAVFRESDLGSGRHGLPVRVVRDVLVIDGSDEAWPPRAAFVFVRRAEQPLAGDHVDVDAVFLVVPELVPERGLGAFLLGDLVLQRCQAVFQLLVGGAGVSGFGFHGLVILLGVREPRDEGGQGKG